jgi:hypothetical protein
MAITKRCNRCLKPMRNDGTDEQPKWVCNNPKCVRYVPPVEPKKQTEEETK